MVAFDAAGNVSAPSNSVSTSVWKADVATVGALNKEREVAREARVGQARSVSRSESAIASSATAHDVAVCHTAPPSTSTAAAPSTPAAAHASSRPASRPRTASRSEDTSAPVDHFGQHRKRTSCAPPACSSTPIRSRAAPNENAGDYPDTYTYDPACRHFTTVSSWLGKQYVTAGGKKDRRILYDNTKRVAFLPFVELAAKSASELELALFLHESLDTGDRELLERNGWHIRHALEVAHTPDSYRSYIQASRGEFSCAKRSCIEFQNAWVSDRSLCYLASGKPVVVQDTGPSSFLPDGEGIFRFSTVDEAAEALATIEAAYERHCRAARAIVEELFDARVVLSAMLNAVETAPAGAPAPSRVEQGRAAP